MTNIIKFKDVAIDAKMEIEHVFSMEELESFSDLTLDSNPLHLDTQFCESTPFKKINVHGQLLSSFIVGIIGSHLPGPGWFCLSVNSDYSNPCFPGQKVGIGIRVKQKVDAINVIVWEGWVKGLEDDKMIVRSIIKTKYLFNN